MTPFRRFALAAAALAATTATGAIAQALTPAQTSAIDKLVTTTLTDTGVPSASIAVVQGGRIVYTKAYGKQSDAIATPRTDVPYQIASISKQFTAAAILLLEVVDVRESMANGGGPACLRLRVVADSAAIDPRFLVDEARLDLLASVIEQHWPETIDAAAIADPALIGAIERAHHALLEAAECVGLFDN